jgi:hypothetical protein
MRRPLQRPRLRELVDGVRMLPSVHRHRLPPVLGACVRGGARAEWRVLACDRFGYMLVCVLWSFGAVRV